MTSMSPQPAPANDRDPQPAPEVREEVARVLQKAPAFQAMSPEDQKAIAKATAQVADYLARPEGFDGRAVGGVVPQGMSANPATLADPRYSLRSTNDKSANEASWAERKEAVDDIGKEKFKANAAREGAAVAGELLREVKFPTFVSSLIEGVFHSITKSSIEQMEAYQDMIANVAKSLKDYMDDHVTENQGRDNLVDQFPDMFEIDFSGDDDGFGDFGDGAFSGPSTPAQPKLKLRDGVDENDALRKVNNRLDFEDGQLKSLDLSDENVEKALVENSRIQLARQRQQLMASIVLMGINRIVVTDGRISAKIKYDVRASDRMSRRRSATAMDVARDRYGNVQTTRAGEGTYDRGGDSDYSYSKTDDGKEREYSADWYSKGEYKFEDKPIITASTTASEMVDAQLQTQIKLQGAVDVNFKSDYLPLDKMATPGMIAAIQGNSRPVDPNVVPSPRGAPPPRPGNGTQTGSGTVAPPPAT